VDDDSVCYECGAGFHAAFTKYIQRVEDMKGFYFLSFFFYYLFIYINY
jgi:hypothetical protein